MASPMRDLFRSRSRVSERIVGEPLEIGERTIRSVARVSGWRAAGGDASAGGAGGQLRVRPAGVTILERDGRERRLPTPDNTRLLLWVLVGVASIIAVASQVVVRVLR